MFHKQFRNFIQHIMTKFTNNSSPTKIRPHMLDKYYHNPIVSRATQNHYTSLHYRRPIRASGHTPRNNRCKSTNKINDI